MLLPVVGSMLGVATAATCAFAGLLLGALVAVL